VVFFKAHDAQVAGLFIGLTCVYVSEFFASLFATRPRRSQPGPTGGCRSARAAAGTWGWVSGRWGSSISGPGCG